MWAIAPFFLPHILSQICHLEVSAWNFLLLKKIKQDNRPWWCSLRKKNTYYSSYTYHFWNSSCTWLHVLLIIALITLIIPANYSCVFLCKAFVHLLLCHSNDSCLHLSSAINGSIQSGETESSMLDANENWSSQIHCVHTD